MDNAVLRFFTNEEIQAFLNSAKMVSPDEIYPIILTGIYTGGRKSELLNLQWNQIDFDHDVIHFLKTKSGKAREVPIHADLRECLLRLPKKGADVFNKTNHRKLFDRAVRYAKLRQVGWHTLRHTFGGSLALKGVDLNTIRELMGHTSITMTLRYAHLTRGHKTVAIQLLDKISVPASTVRVVTNLSQKASEQTPDHQKKLIRSNFLGSSTVERPAVNGKVAGSNPAGGVPLRAARFVGCRQRAFLGRRVRRRKRLSRKS